MRQMAQAHRIGSPVAQGDEMTHEDKRNIVRQMARAYGIDVSENSVDRSAPRETPRKRRKARAWPR